MLKNVFAGLMGKNPILMLSFIEDFINFIVRMVYGLYFLFLKAIAWVLDMLTQLFFIFAGMTPVGTNSSGSEDGGIDIVNFFLTQKSFMKAYGYLCLIALGLIVVFAIAKIIKQDYFDRSGPRSKAPIFRNIALSFIAFICVIPIFYFMIDAVGALALLVMKALGYEGGGIGTMLFNISWEDGGESFRTVGVALMGDEDVIRYCAAGTISGSDCIDSSNRIIGKVFEFKNLSELSRSKVWDDNNFGWYSGDTFYAYYWDETNLGNRETPAQFYWYVFIFAGLIMIVNLGQMLLAMVTRLFKLVALFVVAPSPISQIVLDEGQKFKGWKDQVVQEALKVVGCVMSFMIFLLMASFVPEIDLMKFAFTEEAASASLLESGNMTTELSNSITALYYHGKEPGWIDYSINALGRCMLLVAGVGAIKDIDSTITPFISGGKSSMDMGETGKSLVAAGKAVGSGALAIGRTAVGAAVSGVGAVAGAAAGLAADGLGAVAEGGRTLMNSIGAKAADAVGGLGGGGGDNGGGGDTGGGDTGGGDNGGGEKTDDAATTSTPTAVEENPTETKEETPDTQEDVQPVSEETPKEDADDAATTQGDGSAAESTQAVEEAQENLNDAKRRDNNKNVILDEMQKITDKKPEDRTESDNKRLEQLEKAFNEVDASGDTLHDAQQKYDDAVAAASTQTPQEEPQVEPSGEEDDSVATPETQEVTEPVVEETPTEDVDSTSTEETPTQGGDTTSTGKTEEGGDSTATGKTEETSSAQTKPGGATIHDVGTKPGAGTTKLARAGKFLAKAGFGAAAGALQIGAKCAVSGVKHAGKAGLSVAGTAAKSGLSIAGIAAKTLFSVVGMGGVASAVGGTVAGIAHDTLDTGKKLGKDLVKAGKTIKKDVLTKKDEFGRNIDAKTGRPMDEKGNVLGDDGQPMKDADGHNVQGTAKLSFGLDWTRRAADKIGGLGKSDTLRRGLLRSGAMALSRGVDGIGNKPKTTYNQDTAFNGALDSSSGSSSVSAGYSAINNETADADTVVASANTMIDGANAQMNTAQEMNGLSEQVTGGQNEEMNSRVDLAAAAQTSAAATDARLGAEMNQQGVEAYMASRPTDAKKVKHLQEARVHNLQRNEHGAVEHVATKHGIHSMQEDLRTQHSAIIDKVARNEQLTEDESRQYSAYMQESTNLDSAYRYIDGDTSQGNADAYNGLRERIEGTQAYQDVYNPLTSAATNKERSKIVYESNLEGRTENIEREYEAGMAARAASHVAYTSGVEQTAQDAFNDQYSNSSAYDRVNFQNGNVRESTKRYQEAVAGGNAEAIRAAREDLSSNAAALREATIDLREQMAGTSRDVVKRSRENAERGGVKVGSVKKGKTSTAGASTRGATPRKSGATGATPATTKPVPERHQEVHVEVEGKPVSKPVDNQGPKQGEAPVSEASSGGTVVDIVIDTKNPTNQNRKMNDLVAAARPDASGKRNGEGVGILIAGVMSTKPINVEADVSKVVEAIKRAPTGGETAATESREEYLRALNEYNTEMDAARRFAQQCRGADDTTNLQAVEDAIARATNASDRIVSIKKKYKIED